MTPKGLESKNVQCLMSLRVYSFLCILLRHVNCNFERTDLSLCVCVDIRFSAVLMEAKECYFHAG